MKAKISILFFLTLFFFLITGCKKESNSNEATEIDKQQIGKTQTVISSFVDSALISSDPKSGFQKSVERIKKQTGVESVAIDGRVLSVKYLDGGYEYWLNNENETVNFTLPDIMCQTNMNYSNMQPQNQLKAANSYPRILIINQQFLDESRKDFNDKLLSIGKKAAKNGINVYFITSLFTLDFAKSNFKNYDGIYINTHGALINSNTWLLTSEEFSELKASLLNQTQYELWTNGVLSFFHIAETRGGVRTKKVYYAISQKFFDKNYNSGDFNNTFFYSGACQTMMDPNNAFSKILINKGVKKVVGYDQETLDDVAITNVYYLLTDMIYNGWTYNNTYEDIKKTDNSLIIQNHTSFNTNLVSYPTDVDYGFNLSNKNIPIVTTAFPNDITYNTASSGGNIIADGGSAVTERGICWSTLQNPTTKDNKTNNDLGTGSYTSNLTGLTANTTYYIRAYAVNSVGTAYGNEVNFNTSADAGETVTDIDGNIYHTVKIGIQVWMVENLKTTRLNDGSSIPNITDNTAWTALTTPRYCWYNNDISNKKYYGALYNWHAVNTGKLAPKGWHVPSDEEWQTLAIFLGGYDVAGGKMKEIGTTHWRSPNASATNETGFTALPAGIRHIDGTFDSVGYSGYWWSSTENATATALSYYFSFLQMPLLDQKAGLSVRCIRN